MIMVLSLVIKMHGFLCIRLYILGKFSYNLENNSKVHYTKKELISYSSSKGIFTYYKKAYIELNVIRTE